jgi:hypothetical protein
MAQYTEYKSRRFVLEKDAIKWSKGIKKELTTGGFKAKVETNFLSSTGQWEAVVYRKM